MNNTPVGQKGWLGNPYSEKRWGGGSLVETVEEAIRLFRADFISRVETDEHFRSAVLALRGYDLVCWCAPSPCHGDVILAWLNSI